MRVLVVGSGGREHALTWKIAQSPQVSSILCAPGNPGTSQYGKNLSIPADDVEALVNAAVTNLIDLVVVGPEASLAAGLVDRLAEKNIPAFGPTQEAATLEASKIFAKQFMDRHGIPTASFQIFDDATKAIEYAKEINGPCVVKADGLAAGKGVTVAENFSEAQESITRIMTDRAFGEAGTRIIIEERLVGEEVSLMAITDGKTILPLATARDHKRLLDHDRGPNTGGMGAFSPAADVSEALQEKIIEQVLKPTVEGMAQEGKPLTGILYAGLMIAGEELSVLEFNVRFGDPETQPILMRLESDLVPVLWKATQGNLANVHLEWKKQSSCCVVMASKGYPGTYKKGCLIKGLNEASGLSEVQVFHAGTAQTGDEIVTAGGRVLGVTALGQDVLSAADQAYQAASKISWECAFLRQDIGRA